MERVWETFSEELYLTNKIHNLRVHSFVLMNNHFHLIGRTPDSNISECMHRLLGVVSRRLNEEGNRINGNFAGRHFKTVLQQTNYFLNAYKYNYRNPVAAGLCQKVEEYPYSTLSGLLGQKRLIIPLEEDTTLMSGVEETLKWLNTSPTEAQQEAVRYALKRPYFQSKKSRMTNAPVLGADELI